MMWKRKFVFFFVAKIFNEKIIFWWTKKEKYQFYIDIFAVTLCVSYPNLWILTLFLVLLKGFFLFVSSSFNKHKLSSYKSGKKKFSNNSLFWFYFDYLLFFFRLAWIHLQKKIYNDRVEQKMSLKNKVYIYKVTILFVYFHAYFIQWWSWQLQTKPTE